MNIVPFTRCRDNMVTQNYFIPLTSNGAGNRIYKCDLLEEKRMDEKSCHYSAPSVSFSDWRSNNCM